MNIDRNDLVAKLVEGRLRDCSTAALRTAAARNRRCSHWLLPQLPPREGKANIEPNVSFDGIAIN